MKIYNCRWAVLGVLLLGVAGLAQAGTFTLGTDTFEGVLPTTPGGTNYQAYYDSTTNLTWLANANVNGLMTWSAANNWAEGLDINGVNGWTLPTTTQPDPTCFYQIGGVSYGNDCTGSEMGHFFYDALYAEAFLRSPPFTNVQSIYWSATEYAPDTSSAWNFDFAGGYQAIDYKTYSFYGWAVHAGDVGAPVSAPEPGALALMLAGLALVGFAARRRLALR